MRSLHLLILGAVLTLPVPTSAQTVKRDALIGTWIGTMVSPLHDRGYEGLYDSTGKILKRSKVPVQYRLTLQADSTWEQKVENVSELDLGSDYRGGVGEWYVDDWDAVDGRRGNR